MSQTLVIALLSILLYLGEIVVSYILKRQFFSVFLGIVLWGLEFFKYEKAFNKTLIFLFLLIWTSIVPIIKDETKKYFQIHRKIYTMIFYFGMYVVSFLFVDKLHIKFTLHIVLITMLFSALCYFTSFNFSKKTLLFGVGSKINRNNILFDRLIALISEELFFRYSLYFLVNNNYDYVISSTIMFVYIHYFNRWSSKIFSMKSYLLQGILGIILATAFLISHNIISCIIIHFFYNLPLYIKELKIETGNEIEFEW